MSNVKNVVVPEGWKIEKLGNILDYEQPDKYIVKSTEYRKGNKTPVLTANKAFILGYTDEIFGIYNNLDVIIYDDFTMDLKYVNFTFKVKSSAIKIIKTNNKYNLYYIYSLLKNLDLSPDSHKRSYISEVQPLKVNLPKSLQEQQKIAEILSTVDEAIEKTDSLIEKYKKIKTGLMEDLFTKGIDVNTGKPHTKFKDSELGRIPESWEVGKLSEKMKVMGGYAFKSKDETDYGIPWLKIANVGIGKVKWKEQSFLPNNYKSIYSDFIIKEGNIILALTRPLLNKKLKITKVSSSDGVSLLNQRVGKFNCFNINNIFSYYLFVSSYFINAIDIEILGTDPPNIGTDQIGKIKVKIPKNIKEQQKIAEILSEADNKIEKEEAYKNKLMMIKKGLMSDLLTGKVRVEY